MVCTTYVDDGIWVVVLSRDGVGTRLDGGHSAPWMVECQHFAGQNRVDEFVAELCGVSIVEKPW